MFNPKTERIKKLSEIYPKTIEKLEDIFGESANIYIDWQNMIHWQEKLNWHFCLKRLKQFLDSFDNIKSINIYTGFIPNNNESMEQIETLERLKYKVGKKPVKPIILSIDASSIPENSPYILKNFISKELLSKIDLEAIEYLNKKLLNLNKQGLLEIEKQKCNFDVELGMDVQKDLEAKIADNYIIFSGDSDFAATISRIREKGKNATIFSISRKVTTELNQTGVLIFDIKKIREFICWPKEIPQNIKSKIGE